MILQVERLMDNISPRASLRVHYVHYVLNSYELLLRKASCATQTSRSQKACLGRFAVCKTCLSLSGRDVEHLHKKRWRDTAGTSAREKRRDLHLHSSISLQLSPTSRRSPTVSCIMTPGALLLLLAAAVSQVDSQAVTVNAPSGDVNISLCPITFYGRSFSWLEIKFNQDSHFAICFKNAQNETAQDCLSMESGEETNSMDVQARIASAPIQASSSLTNITSKSKCYISFALKKDSDNIYHGFMFNFDTQAAFRFGSYNEAPPAATLNATVNGISVASETFDAGVLLNNVYMDVSGCRVSGEALAAGSSRLQSDTCSSASCNGSAVLSSGSTCGPWDLCLGNNTCVTPVCTVTGSSVIDFHGRLVSIQDRCGYTLMKPQQGSDFGIDAGFLERRRKDVSLLDHLIIVQSNKTIALGQGGSVVVEGQTLMLNATAQVVHGVKLSKDQTGVTAELLSSNVTVFFDGNTAHVSGLPGAVQGLCGNPSNQSQTTTTTDMKITVNGCATLHNDTIDGTINCNRSTERCNLLKQAPFSAGHSVTDPQSFVDACEDTLCNYPAVDGLNCQFMEAYAESCRLKANVTLGDWRSAVNCSAVPQAPCLEHHCGEHEFCGEKLGERRCFCRALFSSKYTPTNALGEPTVCTNDSATVTLAGCLLQDKGIDYSVLHLNDPSCKGRMDNQTHMVTFSFDSSNTCGTNVSMNNSQILYNNAIVTRNASESGVITRHDQVRIDFSCLYTKPDIRSVSFRIKDSSVVQQIVSGVWNYTLMMNAYTDAGRMSLINQSTPIQLNQKVWVELKTEGLDGDMVSVVTDSCWATNQPLANGSVRYELVKDGCPNKADQTVKMEGNGLGTSSSFSFNMFEFSGQQSDIYLHCKLELCPNKGSAPCAPSCASKRKRRSSGSKAADGNPALITMAWSN